MISNTSPWLDNPCNPNPGLKENVETEVVIIGGGVTGVSTAYHLSKKGIDTVLLEADVLGGSSSGLSLGILALGNESDLIDAVETFEEENAQKIWSDSLKSIGMIEDTIANEKIECGFQKTGGLYLTNKKSHARYFKEEVDLRNRLGFDATFLTKREVASKINSNSFHAAIYSKYECQLNPVQFVRGLAKTSISGSARIFEKSKVISTEIRDGAIKVKTDSGEVRGKFLVFASGTETFNSGILGGRVFPMYSHAIATETLSPDVLEKLGWKSREAMWDSYYIYKDWRLTPDNRIIVGGDDAWASNGIKRYSKLHKFLVKNFPVLKGVNVTHYWAGRLGFTADLLPIIARDRKNQRIFQCSGYNGHGLTFGFLAGSMVCDAICNSEAENMRLYSTSRKSKKFTDKIDRLPMPKRVKMRLVEMYLSWLKIKDKIA